MSRTTAVIDVPRFGEIAQRLVDNGYRPGPLSFEDKRPIVKGWPDYQFNGTVLDVYSRPSVFAQKKYFPRVATMLILGEVIAVDIDVRSLRIVQKIMSLTYKMLGPGPDRVGDPPKVLRLFRTERPFAKMRSRNFSLAGDDINALGYKFHAVEILGRGQQCVAYAIHKKTGRPYEWVSGGEPLTTPVDQLTEVTEAQCREYIRAVEKLLLDRECGARAHGKSMRKRTDGESAASGDYAASMLTARNPAECRKALAAIPNPDDLHWDDWVKIGLAIAGAFGAEGYLDWHAFSRKCKKYDKATTNIAWGGFMKALSEKRVAIGAGSIYYMAGEAGWKRPDQRVGILRLWRRAFTANGMRL